MSEPGVEDAAELADREFVEGEPTPSEAVPAPVVDAAPYPADVPAEEELDAAKPVQLERDVGRDEPPETIGAPDEETVELVRDDLPDISSDVALDAALEALLLIVDSPASEHLLATALGQSLERVETALKRLAARYTEQERGIDLRRAGDGWRFYTRDTYAPFVERMLVDGQRAKLTRAALETLAVVAYRQPVTRSRVAAVRGVNVDGVIRTLLARGLIEETGADPDTGGTLYRTTELFLERLGLSSLEELPPIAPLLPEVDSIDDV